MLLRRRPAIRRFVPDFIRCGRFRLIGTEPRRIYLCVYKILRRYGCSGHPPKHSELSGMRHRIGQRTLEQLLSRQFTLTITEQKATKVLQDLVEPSDLVSKGRQRIGPIAAASKECPRIPE